MANQMLGKPRITTVEGASIAWTEVGEGEPLILLHGLGDSHRTWRRVVTRLAPRFRLIMPDLPGHGLSSRPDAPYTLDWYASTLLAWADQLDLSRAHVAGHSFGGGVAQWMLLQQPRRISKLALVAPGGLGTEVAIGLRLASFPVLAPILAPYLMGVGTHVMMRTGQLVRPEPEEIARIAWMNSAPGTARAFCRTVSGVMDLFGQTVQSWDRIHEVPALPPIALFWGDRDRILPVHHATAAATRIEGATLARYARAGHFPQLEESERFADDLLRFLDDEVPSNPRIRPLLVRARRPSAVRRFFLRLGNSLRTALRAIA